MDTCRITEQAPKVWRIYAEKRKNGELFSDRMMLNVLCLKHEKLATESEQPEVSMNLMAT